MHKTEMKILQGIVIAIVTTQLGLCQTNPNIIRCRHCTRATSLELCSSLTACDKNTQVLTLWYSNGDNNGWASEIHVPSMGDKQFVHTDDPSCINNDDIGCPYVYMCSTMSCYMDQFITQDAKIYYSGGCRENSACQAASGVVFGKKRDDGDLKSCSRCCNSRDDCNKRLCGINSETLTSQCYSCDAVQANGDQGLVDDPIECRTLDFCQSDEICLSYTRKTAAGDKYGFRCEKLKVCELLMQRVLLDYQSCHDSPDPNLCGILDRKRSTDTCFACCGEGGCNSRSCEELKEYIWTLKKKGALNETFWKPL